ncbi:MAG TPA: putative lipid II flippase FtsW [Terriglobales bacterium]|nr:putative lipid II flippase FtsW [Terriglobales bacterium]
MAKRVSLDKVLFSVTLVLVVIGVVFVFSASAVMAKDRYGSPYTFFFRQLAWAVVGLLAMVVIAKINYRHYQRPSVVFTALSVTTLLLLIVFFLDRSHNTHRWIHAGPFSLQPSELAKPAIILFLAYFLESRTRTLNDWRSTLIPAVLPPLLLAALIVGEPDLGTALACLAITICVLFAAGLDLKYIGYGFVALLPVLCWLVFLVPWRARRMMVFLHPGDDVRGAGFHIWQSLIAVGTGGLSGVGLMEGKQKLFYLPEPHTDFIFSVIAEEIGLIGAVVVVALFTVFMVRGLRAATLAPDNFARFLAVGITAMIAVQALFNISVVLGLLPTKGIPLPFISYGGSSLFIMLASMGVLLNITQHVE